MWFDATIMGGDEQLDLEYRFVHDACGLNYDKYLKNRKTLTRKIFEKNFNKILDIIQSYSSYKFNIAYQVLGRFVLLLGIDISDGIRNLIIQSTEWIYEKGTWDDDFVHERKFRLKDLRNRISEYQSGKELPLEEDLILYPEFS